MCRWFPLLFPQHPAAAGCVLPVYATTMGMLLDPMAGNPFRHPQHDLEELARRVAGVAPKHQQLGVAHARAILGQLPERARNAHERIALASARAYRALVALRGGSTAMQRVRRETWAACFGETLTHALHLERV